MPTTTNTFPGIPVYTAQVNEHPYSTDLLGTLNQFGVDGLLNPSSSLKRQQWSANDLANFFPTNAVNTPLPQTEFDFSFGGTYSIYNWEIFFHSVSLIARQLRLNNKFAEAIRWLNFIFDPADPDTALNDLRYWQLKPFMINVTQGSIQNMIRLLSSSNLSAADQALRLEYEAQISAWRKNPFEPHVIAAMRPRAYMLWTVMEYITTLTDWGDYLFRQDTMESVNEAINLYVIASEILGPRPKKITRPTPAPKSFDDIYTQLSAFSNVMVAFENQVTSLNNCKCAMDGANSGLVSVALCEPSSGVNSIPDLFFCIPDNPKLVEMWDRVEDRLFKIRHCLNIDGKKRQLALFSPPIDPALLVQAVAGGLSIGDALADLAAPLPHYRFAYLMQKANEFCGEVKGLGAQLLSLLEKKDAEELSLFRQVHEQNILKSVRSLKEMAIEEAKQTYATLQSSKTLIQIRLDDYSSREYRNNRELTAMTLTRTADGFMYAEQGVRLVAGLVNLIPDIDITASAITTPPSVSAGTDVTLPFGGAKISILANAGANALGIVSSALRNKASQSLTFASYDRREEDWNLQIKTAREELLQVDRQLLGAEIRIAVTEKELANHDLQIEQSNEMYDWLKNKYTNKELYSWMLGQVKVVYRQAFDLAYGMAKRSQVCYDFELGKSATNIIQYGQWDSTRSGLLAGERLSLQLRQMETEYIKNNDREYELSKNISLALLDPAALEQLKATGKCDIYLPELLFDMDYSNHYFRRIKSVSISIPCIAGSQTNINATLMLQSHGTRKVTTTPISAFTDPLDLGYAESIATSGSQNDSGVFELNFKDERYLPFEGKGAISKWTLELSQIKKANKNVIRLFDFTTISDVVMHMKYTAREAGSAFADAVANYLDTNLGTVANLFNSGGVTGMTYAFSLRHDMPNAWNEFKNNGATNFMIDKGRLPYLMQAITPRLLSLTFITELSVAATGAKFTLTGLNAPAGANNITLTLNPAAPQPVLSYTGSGGTLTSDTALNNNYTLAAGTNLIKANVNDIVVIARLKVDW